MILFAVEWKSLRKRGGGGGFCSFEDVLKIQIAAGNWKQEIKHRKCWDIQLKDIMPLVDHGKLNQQDEGGDDIIEVILAVVELCKVCSIQQRITTICLCWIGGALFIKRHLPFKELHPHHGKNVVHHLWRNTTTDRTIFTNIMSASVFRPLSRLRLCIMQRL